MEPFSFQVKPGEGGQTLLSYLRAQLIGRSSVKGIKRSIDRKKCMINGKIEFFSTHPISVGDRIEIVLEENKEEKLPLPATNVLYEDEAIIALNKPAGITSEALLSMQTGSWRLVHRLDKETSGIILFAKTAEAESKLIASFAAREMHKTYLAICSGHISKIKWRIDNFLGKKASYDGGALYGSCSKEKGKRATTEFERLATSTKATLLQIKPNTGRTHQIRVHLAEMGHPILGDFQYGAPPIQNLLVRHMLHALKLIFPHPVDRREMSLSAPIPADFSHLKKSLFGSDV